LEAKFKAPAKLGDLLSVKTEVLSLKGSSLLLKQSVFKEETLLFEMDIKLGFVQKGKIGRMSKESQSYLNELFLKEV